MRAVLRTLLSAVHGVEGILSRGFFCWGRYDVREVDRELDELERLVNEAGAKNKFSGAEEERLSQWITL